MKKFNKFNFSMDRLIIITNKRVYNFNKNSKRVSKVL